jgi:plastocyanin
MSNDGRRVPLPALIGVVALLVTSALLPALSSAPGREIVLVADGMTFRAEDGAANPVIEVRAGDVVRVVLRNDEGGMRHDFALPALDVAIDLLDVGETGAVTFVAPAEPGEYEYICRPHALMMRGVLRVLPAGA